jgi:hypothetical protein
LVEEKESLIRESKKKLSLIEIDLKEKEALLELKSALF